MQCAWHDLRNLAEYEGHVDVGQRLVMDVVTACEIVARGLDAAVREPPAG